VGLVQVIPVILLALVAGQAIDRLDRRHVIIAALITMTGCSLGLAVISWRQADYRWIYVCLFVNGIARAFLQPGKSALLPLIVTRTRFANAVTWSTSGFQLASVIGPSLGGLMIAWTGSAAWVYCFDAVLSGAFVAACLTFRPRPPTASQERIGLRSLFAGAAFVWRTKLILGAISLDMFAVLLGGATALLPVYAEILEAGPEGLGWLRAAPGLGALLTSCLLTLRPPIRRAGLTLLWSVTAFGLATVVFGLTRWFWVSWAMLFVTGAFDMVSVVIRHTLIQLWTPDAMRGRVSAINGMFIGISNELGEFESGTVAHLFERPGSMAFGPTVSVVSGGIGTILVVLLAAGLCPELRRHGRLDEGPRVAST
jgi:MFS family permease